MEMTIEFGEGKQVNAVFNGFKVCTDQPLDEGGQGTAPEPYALFMASIGTCAGIYALGFCQVRDIDTKNLKMSAYFTKNEKSHLIETARIVIDVPDDFPEKYMAALQRTVQMCTVKRSIADPPEFLIDVTKAASP